MRIANLSERLVLVDESGAVDVERASGGQFSADPQAVYDRWDEFTSWVAGAGRLEATPYDPGDLGAPAPLPRQLLAIGLNYGEHAEESGIPAPDVPAVFTKFVTAITGPYGEVTLPPGNVDWEAELVVVIGRRAWNVAPADAWSCVAGLTIGQDLSERSLQFAGPAQWSMAKSHPGFAPMGPWLVTPDEFDDPGNLELGCAVNGEQMQKDRTSNLIFSVPAFIAWLSSILPLLPGDVLYTGTPAGVGQSRNPPRFLAPGDELVTWIQGIGEMRHHLV